MNNMFITNVDGVIWLLLNFEFDFKNFHYNVGLPLQEIPTFFTKSFGKNNPRYGFFAPMSNLTKMPFWTSWFGPKHFDKVFLVGFFTGFFY